MTTLIRLLGPDGTTIIDSLSGDYEDSFTIETFSDSSNQHFDAEPKNTKGFIIARVQTMDPKQPEKVRYTKLGFLLIL